MLEFHDVLCAATRPLMRLRSASWSLVSSVSVVDLSRISEEASKSDPTDFRQLDSAVALVQALKFDILSRKGEGVVLELLAWRGVSAQPLKEAAERLVEVAQRVWSACMGAKSSQSVVAWRLVNSFLLPEEHR
jgi:hypothetical protein